MKYTYDNRHNYKLIEAVDHYGLECPCQLYGMTQEESLDRWNGIGSRGAWYNKLIPNTVYGLDISLASAPHDIAYDVGVSMADKLKADKEFYHNMCRIIDAESCWALKWVRKRRAYKYYLAVKMFGNASFKRIS